MGELTVQKIRDLASRAMQNPWFAYGTIFLLQLKTVWGMWLFRDLTSGDTSYYFLDAWNWYRNSGFRITWSPLYTTFYGTFLHLSTDAYAATIAHRLTTVLVLSVMILALMRRLLPPGIAWMMAAWWVVLPINFDSLYEVHLFAVIPVAAAVLLILWKPGPWGRGCGLAAMLATAILMRNELLLATLLFGAVAMGWDLRRKSPGLAKAYGIPLGAACLAILLCYAWSNDERIADAAGRTYTRSEMLSRKHTLNVCQVYAFGYQQRHSDWTGFPWTECQQLMTRIYGTPEPALTEALRRNPSAMIEHFWWNLQLVPNGLQVLLFNCMSGSVTPDYIPASARFWPALIASLLTLTIAALGMLILWHDREYWWKFWLSDRIWAWVAMACVSMVVMVVMVTQRPRPSYMLAFGIVLRAALGMCLVAVLSRFPRFGRLAPAVPLAAVVFILFAPCYYYGVGSGVQRPLLDIYWRLAPFQQNLEKPGAALVAAGWSPELCNYLGKSRACRPLDTNQLRLDVTPETPWDKILAKHGATLFYLDDGVMADSPSRQFVSAADSHGWHTVALHSEPGQNWAVLERAEAPATLASTVLAPAIPAVPAPDADIVVPGSGITLGKGWYEFEIFGGERFRWVSHDAELVIERAEAGPVSLLLEVEAGPGLAGKPLSLQAFGNGKRLPVMSVKGRTLSIPLPSGNMEVRLDVDSANSPTPGDARILNFRVFKISVR